MVSRPAFLPARACMLHTGHGPLAIRTATTSTGPSGLRRLVPLAQLLPSSPPSLRSRSGPNEAMVSPVATSGHPAMAGIRCCSASVRGPARPRRGCGTPPGTRPATCSPGPSRAAASVVFTRGTMFCLTNQAQGQEYFVRNVNSVLCHLSHTTLKDSIENEARCVRSQYGFMRRGVTIGAPFQHQLSCRQVSAFMSVCLDLCHRLISAASQA